MATESVPAVAPEQGRRAVVADVIVVVVLLLAAVAPGLAPPSRGATLRPAGEASTDQIPATGIATVEPTATGSSSGAAPSGS